jgi:hypothetical protein
MTGSLKQRGAIAGIIAILTVAAPAIATDADELIAQGIRLRKDSRDQDALPLFRQAYEQRPTPRAAGQLGTCEQALGLWLGAEKHIQEALKHLDDSWVHNNDASLRSSLSFVQQRLGSIDVWGSPPGARVSIDGDFVSILPMAQPARAAVGRRTITIEAPGFFPESRTIETLPGALLREHVVLRSMAVRSAPSEPAPSVEPAVGQPTLTDSRMANESPIYSKWWFWTAIGAVAIAGGATTYFLVTRNQGCESLMGGTCTTF